MGQKVIGCSCTFDLQPHRVHKMSNKNIFHTIIGKKPLKTDGSNDVKLTFASVTQAIISPKQPKGKS